MTDTSWIKTDWELSKLASSAPNEIKLKGHINAAHKGVIDPKCNACKELQQKKG